MSVGKSSFMHAVFLLLLGLISMGIGLGTIPFQDMKNPQSLCQAYHIVWEYLCFVLFSLMREWDRKKECYYYPQMPISGA